MQWENVISKQLTIKNLKEYQKGYHLLRTDSVLEMHIPPQRKLKPVPRYKGRFGTQGFISPQGLVPDTTLYSLLTKEVQNTRNRYNIENSKDI